MKRLNNLRKQLPSNAKLNTFEFTRVKGGADKPAPRLGGSNITPSPTTTVDRPSGKPSCGLGG